MRINVWISFKGLQENSKFMEFPYTALYISTGKKEEFHSIDDVYDEIKKLYDVAIDKGYNVGESLFTETLFFASHSLLINGDMQNRIKEYQFCKKFNCPPSQSLQTVPANIVDDFMTIDDEYNLCLLSDQKKRNK